MLGQTVLQLSIHVTAIKCLLMRVLLEGRRFQRWLVPVADIAGEERPRVLAEAYAGSHGRIRPAGVAGAQAIRVIYLLWVFACDTVQCARDNHGRNCHVGCSASYIPPNALHADQQDLLSAVHLPQEAAKAAAALVVGKRRRHKTVYNEEKLAKIAEASDGEGNAAEDAPSDVDCVPTQEASSSSDGSDDDGAAVRESCHQLNPCLNTYWQQLPYMASSEA